MERRQYSHFPEGPAVPTDAMAKGQPNETTTLKISFSLPVLVLFYHQYSNPAINKSRVVYGIRARFFFLWRGVHKFGGGVSMS